MTIRLSAEQAEELQTVATVDNRPISEVIRAAIAEHIQQDRAYHDLPVLADALDDAGCDKPEIIAHCRGNGPHVRGCWVLDIILAKDR